MGLKKIAPGIHIGTQSGSLIEITQKKYEPDALHTATQVSAYPYAYWGTRNRLPLEILDTVKQEPVSMGALGFKIDAHYGQGPQLYEKEYVKQGKKTVEVLHPVAIEQYPEIDDFFFENNIENFCQSIIQDFEYFNRYHVQYIPNGARNKIVRINSGISEGGSANFLRTKDIRKAKRDKQTGKIPGFYLSGDWTEGIPQTTFVPAFDPTRPFAQTNAIYEHKLTSISNDYYVVPRWYSNLKWLEVARKIPEWINSNIDNSINIKYHIKIPEKYFIDLYPEDRYETTEECYEAREEAETEIKTQIDQMLAGAGNVHKAIYTKFAVDESGNQMPGWEITPIPNDIKDEAWLRADQTAAIRILTAHNVDPTLAGIIIGNTSSGSGADVREKINMHMQLRTIIGRQTTTEWFNFVKRFNGWDRKLCLGYKNFVLQTLDENKSGVAQQNEPTPTTPNNPTTQTPNA